MGGLLAGSRVSVALSSPKPSGPSPKRRWQGSRRSAAQQAGWQPGASKKALHIHGQGTVPANIKLRSGTAHLSVSRPLQLASSHDPRKLNKTETSAVRIAIALLERLTPNICETRIICLTGVSLLSATFQYLFCLCSQGLRASVSGRLKGEVQVEGCGVCSMLQSPQKLASSWVHVLPFWSLDAKVPLQGDQEA